MKIKNIRDTWKHKKGKHRTQSQLTIIDVNGKEKLMSVLFVSHTEKSEMAKCCRAQVETFEKFGSLKFSRENGRQAHKSSVDIECDDIDCERQNCLTCEFASEEQRKACVKNAMYFMKLIVQHVKKKGIIKASILREKHVVCLI